MRPNTKLLSKFLAKSIFPASAKAKCRIAFCVNYVGEPAILEDAVELLSQEVYREVLPQTDLDPYGPGVLTDVKSDEPTPTFVYSCRFSRRSI